MNDIRLQKGLPANLDAERFVLGSILLDDSQYALAAGILDADDFSLEKHRRIWMRMSELHERGERIDRVTISEELAKHDQLEACDGIGYIVSLDDGLPQIVNLESYIAIVKEKATLRKTVFAAQGLIDRCLMAGETASEVLDDAEAVLAKIGDNARRRVRLKSTEAIKLDYPGGVNAFFYPEDHKQYIPSPWPSLDEIIHGWKPNQLIVIAARPGIGKSAAASQIAAYAAENGRGVALFSLEMSASEILVRMICQRASVNSWKYHEGNLDPSERAAFQRASHEIDSWKRIWIDDSTGCTVPALQSAIRKQRVLHPIGLVIVDYLTLMEAHGKHENRNQEVSVITRGLKKMARELEIPVIVLAQLNRQSVNETGRPQLHHLRESGSIEQDADIVIFLHEPQGNNATADPNVKTEFIVAKHRNGPTGKRTLTFLKRFTRFEDTNEFGSNKAPLVETEV